MEPHVRIRGDWLNAIWQDAPVLVSPSVDVASFLGQEALPMLFPKDEAYVRRTKCNANDIAEHALELGFAAAARGNPQVALKVELALQWVIVLLHHPDTTVARDALLFWEQNWQGYVQSERDMPYHTLFYDSVVDHLLSDDAQLAEAATRFIWRTYSSSNFSEKLFPILTDPRFRDCEKAVRRLSSLCPREHKTEFRELVRKQLHFDDPSSPDAAMGDKQESGDARGKFKHAKDLFAQAEFERALSVLEDLNSAHPGDKNILFPMAMCLEKLGKLEDAKNICDSLIQKGQHEKASVLKRHIQDKLMQRSQRKEAKKQTRQTATEPGRLLAASLRQGAQPSQRTSLSPSSADRMDSAGTSPEFNEELKKIESLLDGRRAPSSVQAALMRACRRAGLTKEQAVSHLTLRLRNAPDVLEFLDAETFTRTMQERFTHVQDRVASALAQPFAVDESAIRRLATNPTAQGRLPDFRGHDPQALRIQAVHVVGKVVSEQIDALISGRLKRAGTLMMNNAGAQVDTGTLLQMCIQQANAEMTAQWAQFYAVYALLGGPLVQVLKGWDWEEAIDAIMAWPGDTHPFLGLAAFLQGYWGNENPENLIAPRVLAGRAMGWLYCYPDRWETLKRALEMAGIHAAAIRHGRVETSALKQQWREFATEVARLATILKDREAHKTEADGTLEHCKKLGASQCFIATAACGSEDASDVITLRRLRDDVLRRRRGGRLAIRVYEAVSPAIALRIAPSAYRRAATRWLVVRPASRMASALLRHGQKTAVRDGG